MYPDVTNSKTVSELQSKTGEKAVLGFNSLGDFTWRTSYPSQRAGSIHLTMLLPSKLTSLLARGGEIAF
jgi:hypothetical protein